MHEKILQGAAGFRLPKFSEKLSRSHLIRGCNNNEPPHERRAQGIYHAVSELEATADAEVNRIRYLKHMICNVDA